ncbi:MAG: hypothetical protein M5R38_08030 [Candidatus Methylomirabilis sp.]|nr:hypothetical protein [Candidatus Methylomirabilis sp.]
MDSERLIRRLAGIVGTEHVLVAESCALYTVDDRIPTAVVFPGDEQRLSGIMKLASSERLSVAPWGAERRSASEGFLRGSIWRLCSRG